ncbi:hypothetical protein N180_17955 [Pedobacter antarcticus 4BY]|uniref:Uncharacterized protein n=2 Tax=Pedobacter antarcticus TaxID=34086 RepID=A0A081PG70_9SPHI|nr:flippase [Pedobacter antarcticus]KEQ29693.1 hypothetical protein N180_17955 [Pedobacter antarcticus 4BY]SFF13090.1 Membrane protein involved in the export of O-antigen and teichoic acid [Pedobacter antarcticus]
MAKNYFYNLLLSLANLLFPILSFPYVSRILGPEGIGKVQFIYSFAMYFALVASLGIPIYGMKEIARRRNDPDARSAVFSELFIVNVITSVVLTIAYLLVIFFFPYFQADRNLFIAAGLLILLSFSYIEWLYTGMEEFRSIALRSVLFKLIGLVLMYTFIRDRNDFGIYLLIMIFSFMGNNLLSLFLSRSRVKLVLRDLKLRRHIVPLLMILSTTFATSMYTEMDTVLLGLLANNKTVGLYTAAVKLSKIIIPFVTSMGVVLIPRIAKYFAEENLEGVQETLNENFRFLAFFSVPIAMGLMLFAPEFIALFSGKEFLPATLSMQLLSFLPVVIGFGHLFLCLILIPAGKNKEMLFSVICGMVISVLLNFLLVPVWKEVGSSIANLSAETLVSVMYFYFIRKHFKFTYQWSLMGKALLSTILFIPVIWMARIYGTSLILTLILGIGGCAICYVATQLFLFRNYFVFSVLDFLKAKLMLKNKV